MFAGITKTDVLAMKVPSFNLIIAIYVQFLALVFAFTARAEVVEGNVYRENSSAEVYLISAGKKIWVPTPDALFAMGLSSKP